MQPIFNETSAANGSQFGGLTAYMGQGEIQILQPTDAKLCMLELDAERSWSPATSRVVCFGIRRNGLHQN